MPETKYKKVGQKSWKDWGVESETQYMKAGQSNRGASSIWESVVRDKDGNLKHHSAPHPNLRMDSGDDWQAFHMSGGPASIVFATAAGTATSTTATSLTNTGAAFPTTAIITGATGGLAGQIVVASSDAGSNVYGIILSNTATVLTIDRWVAASDPFTVATTPAGTAKYSIPQAFAPAWYMALSATVITVAATDVVLSGEFTTIGFSRTQRTTFTHTIASSIYTIAKTYTATGTGTVNSEANLTATGAAGVGAAATSGVMVFESLEPNPPTLVSGDTLAQTISVTY